MRSPAARGFTDLRTPAPARVLPHRRRAYARATPAHHPQLPEHLRSANIFVFHGRNPRLLGCFCKTEICIEEPNLNGKPQVLFGCSDFPRQRRSARSKAPDVHVDLPCSASGEVLSFGVTLSWEYEDNFPHLKLLPWL